MLQLQLVLKKYLRHLIRTPWVGNQVWWLFLKVCFTCCGLKYTGGLNDKEKSCATAQGLILTEEIWQIFKHEDIIFWKLTILLRHQAELNFCTLQERPEDLKLSGNASFFKESCLDYRLYMCVSFDRFFKHGCVSRSPGVCVCVCACICMCAFYEYKWRREYFSVSCLPVLCLCVWSCLCTLPFIIFDIWLYSPSIWPSSEESTFFPSEIPLWLFAFGGVGGADTSFGEAERYIDVSERIFSWLWFFCAWVCVCFLLHQCVKVIVYVWACIIFACVCSISGVVMDMSSAQTHIHTLLTWMLSGQWGLQWCPASWKYPLSLPLPAMQRVIFNQLSPLHPLSMLHRAIAPTLLPPSHFIFIFILSLVTGGGDNRCKAKLWVAYPPSSLFLFSFQQKTTPLSFHLSFSCFFFCFACLSLYLYHSSGLLSHPTPPLPLVVFLFTSQSGFPGRGFLLLAVGEADVQ